MVLAQRRRASRVSLTLPRFVVGSIALVLFVFVVPNQGQPNYYFKASAPAVKSLPRIGRRSDDGGSEGSSPLSLARSMDISGGILDILQTLGNNGGGGQQFDSFSSSGSKSTASQNTPTASASLSSNAMGKALLWRKLFGDGGGNGYDESALDNFYRSKS